MDTHADQPLTPGELARVGCMSVRALHATFQDELGVSPMAHLRRIRLDHVHAELLRSPDPEVRISDVAMRWGFSIRAGSPGSTTSGSGSSPRTPRADAPSDRSPRPPKRRYGRARWPLLVDLVTATKRETSSSTGRSRSRVTPDSSSCSGSRVLNCESTRLAGMK